MKFRLITGVYIGADPTDTRDLKVGERRREIHYNAGDVVESQTDLAERFGSQKFQPLFEGSLREVAPGQPTARQVPKNTNPGQVISPQYTGAVQNPTETSGEIHHGLQAQELADKGLAPAPAPPLATPTTSASTPPPKPETSPVVAAPVAVVPIPDNLDSMDEKKLRDLAVVEKIKVNGADSKEKLIETIRKARGPRA